MTRSELDCADRAGLASVVGNLRPRTIVHLAASTAARLHPDAVAPHWRDTFEACRNVVEESVRHGVPHLILAGTFEELGDAAGELTLDTPASPRTLYGLCKSLAREVATFAARQHPVRIDWFRPSTVYGPGQHGPMLIPAACEAAVTGRSMQFTDGSQRRDFLYIDDLIDWLDLAIGCGPEANGKLNLHHLGRGEAVRVVDVIEFIRHQHPEARFEIGAIPRRAYEPAEQFAPGRSSLDPDLAAWSASTPWRLGIERTLQWWTTKRTQP